MRLNDAFIQNAVPGIEILRASLPEPVSFSIDTRTLQKGDVFVALKGSQHDGHEFIDEAVRKGAAGIVVAHHKKKEVEKIPVGFVALVPDTFLFLVQLATAWRMQFTYPVVALTGSVGKTTTRQIVCNILGEHGMRYLATPGNHNTLLGVSLTILRMTSEYQVAVFELGINKRSEMAELAALVKPTTALITCVGHAHMEGLGSPIDVAAEKRMIFSQFTEKNIGIVNGDQPLLSHVSYPHPIIKFGTKTTNQIQARKIRIEEDHISCVIKIYGQKHKITLPTYHLGAVLNVLAAATLGYVLDVPVETIITAIQKKVIIPGRFEKCTLKMGRGFIINDSYNANPESMKAALLALQKLKTSGEKIAVLGDMLELGVNSPFWHRQLGRFLRKVPTLRKVVLVGSMVSWTKKTAPVGVAVEHVATWQEALDAVKSLIRDEAVILVKGSQGVGLGNLVHQLSNCT